MALTRPIPRLGNLRARHLRDRSRGRPRGMFNRFPKRVCPVYLRKLLKARRPVERPRPRLGGSPKAKYSRGKPLRQARLKARRPMERPRPRLGGSPKAKCARGKPLRQVRLKARRPMELSLIHI